MTFDHPINNRQLFAAALSEDSCLSDSARELITAHDHPWEILAHLGTALAALLASKGLDRRVDGIADGIVIEPGARVSRQAVIEPPVYIAGGAQVRAGAYLRGGVWVEPGAVIGHSCEVKASILLPGAKAAHHAYVGDSILGAGVNLGAGTKTANLRFDGASIIITSQYGRWTTSLRKMGAVFGDGSQTGCNVVTNPGTIFLRGAVALPLKCVGGVVQGRKRFTGTPRSYT